MSEPLTLVQGLNSLSTSSLAPQLRGSRRAALASKRLLEDSNESVTEVPQILGVARCTLYRSLKNGNGGS